MNLTIGANSGESSAEQHSGRRSIAVSPPAGQPAGPPRVFRGFARVFEAHHSNADVHAAIGAPLVQHVAAGDTACIFAYGHTGTGKTHTVAGYGSEVGLVGLAIRQLCADLAAKNSVISPCPRLLLQLRFAELHNGRVYDLLADRAECSVREDADGNVHIRRNAQKDSRDGRVRVPLLTSLAVDSEEAALSAIHSALSLRSVGSSTIHDMSSRSHAIVEMEIVSEDLIAAREQLNDAASELPAAAKAKDLQHIRVISKGWIKDPATGQYVKAADAEAPTEQELAELALLESRLADIESRIASFTSLERSILGAGRSLGLGGTLVLADLAGAEHLSASTNTRSTAAVHESREINTSLLALKECIRAIASGKSHIPFRNSKLTLVLRRALIGSNGKSAAITCIASDPEMWRACVDTLSYASLLAHAQ